jgi:uncharacterized membrane protein
MIKGMKKILIAILILLSFVSVSFAQEEAQQKIKGKVVSMNEIECSQELDIDYVCYTYDVYISDTNETITTMSSMLERSEDSFEVGDPVYITSMQDLDGSDTWSITGYVRGNTILLWSLVFVILAILIGGKKSIGSILSLILSFVVLYFFTIPALINSSNLILVGYLAVLVILTLSMYLAHGFKKQTTIALVSTYIGVGIVSVLTLILMKNLNINGMGEENAFLLSSQMGGAIDIRNLFFISVIIGAVGVLDDVAIGQVSSMYEIYMADRNIDGQELYKKTMNVGREHVASMVNTLFIVYAGSSLSLVMLMYLSNRDMGNLVSIDMITEEIVRTLAISIALLLVVPISTYISARMLTK